MKIVIVIGSNGQLGNDIVRIFSKDIYYKVISLTHKEINITNTAQTQLVLQNFSPDIVINTASFHELELTEKDKKRTFDVNALAQSYLSQLSKKNNWVNVFISTDYVFGLNENRKKPYRENETIAPINTYGISKAAGEYFTQYLSKNYFIIRLSGLFGIVGPSGKHKNFIEQMIDLSNKKKNIYVVNDQMCTPTYTKNIAENLKVLFKTEKYGIYHMTSQGECTWWEFAKEIFSLLHIKVNCIPVTSDYFPTNVKRPKYSVLENYNLRKDNIDLMLDWRTNLKYYLKEKGYL